MLRLLPHRTVRTFSTSRAVLSDDPVSKPSPVSNITSPSSASSPSSSPPIRKPLNITRFNVGGSGDGDGPSRQPYQQQQQQQQPWIQGDRPAIQRPGERPPMGDRPQMQRPPMGDRPPMQRPPMGDRPPMQRPPPGSRPPTTNSFGGPGRTAGANGMRRRTPEAPTRARYAASGGAGGGGGGGGKPGGGRPRGGDRGGGGGGSGRRDDRKTDKENPLPAKEVAYTPAPVTLESLLPMVPATPLTVAGLSSVLIRETERVRRRGTEKWGLEGWRRYDRTREVYMRGAVEGGYKYAVGAGGDGSLVAEKEVGTVVGEVRRMAARNSSVGTKAMRLIVGQVQAKVGTTLLLPKPQVRQAIAAAA